MLDGIIFDVDGTLWDARAQVVQAWDTAKRQMVGLPLGMTVEEATGLFGKTMDEIAWNMFPEFTKEQAVEYSAECFQRENALLKDNPGVMYDGVREMVRELAQRYPLFIVSNCQCGYIEIMMEAGGLTDYFSGHLCYGDTETSKGKTIRTLMKRHGLEHVIYVGDTQGDADACKEADVPFLFVEYGFGTVDETYPRAKTVQDIPRVLAELDR